MYINIGQCQSHRNSCGNWKGVVDHVYNNISDMALVVERCSFDGVPGPCNWYQSLAHLLRQITLNQHVQRLLVWDDSLATSQRAHISHV